MALKLPQMKSTLGRPISQLEFSSALLPVTWRQHAKPRTVGLAISGGVDSMALAALCSNNHKSHIEGSHVPRIKFQAFVVDHGVRDGSHAEATAVSKVLEAQGIPTKVLKINWGGLENPGHSKNFESLARRFRYQILGRACRDHAINSLLLAHHQDDHVETLLMRMAAGARSLGLRCMKPESEIPECEGIYGVHQSGGDLESRPVPDTGPVELQATSYGDKQLRIETGGVKIYRPLLDFTKARLVATCLAEKMEWFEDSTNKDPTLTQRNAVRHMLKTHKLPAAFGKESLLSLSRRVNDKRITLVGAADAMLKKCKISKFETRAGTLHISFPTWDKAEIPPLSQQDHYNAAAYLLRQVILAVTPKAKVILSWLNVAVDSIFPELTQQEERASKPVGFTVAGVRFQPTNKGGLGTSSKPAWSVSRESYPRALPQPLLTIPHSRPQLARQWSSWELWDGRFWIRVQHSLSTPLIIRPLREIDMQQIKEEMPSNLRKKELAKAPGDVRWTLPVIVAMDRKGKDVVLALPTLEVKMKEAPRDLRWDVRYKKVDVVL